MSDFLILESLFSFAVFFFAGRWRNVAAAAGWSFIVLNLWYEVPAYLRENNFVYPLLALLSIPFIVITIERLLRDDPVVMQLSRTAAVATLVFVPFAIIPVLRDTLISLVIGISFTFITALGHHPVMLAWDMMGENGFVNQIIPGCTGILAIAMMLGVAYGAAGMTGRHVLLSFILVVPVIAVLNLMRVSVVFIAVSDHWFGAFPDPTGTGDANFFWAHNVFAEGSAIVVLFVLVYGLFRINPGLAVFARDLAGAYHDRVRQFFKE
jgi:archaeosortase A (PGF-CTERM-specific)